MRVIRFVALLTGCAGFSDAGNRHHQRNESSGRLLLADIVMKGTLTPVLFLIAGGLLFTAGWFVVLNLVVALLLMVLAAAAFIGCLVTKNRLANALGRTAIIVSATVGIVLVLLSFVVIYFGYWYKSSGG